jgi:hypothetical protein
MNKIHSIKLTIGFSWVVVVVELDDEVDEIVNVDDDNLGVADVDLDV